MTMTIHEISDKFKISIRKLNELEKAGLLVADKKRGRSVPSQMIYYLKKQKPLTTEHVLMLYKNPDLFEELGEYEGAARKQLRDLGDISRDAIAENFAPTWIFGAAIADNDVLPKAVEWLLHVIPAKGCGYHYIAARMLCNVPEKRFAESYKFLARAILNCRNHPLMRDRWTKFGSGLRFHKIKFDL